MANLHTVVIAFLAVVFSVSASSLPPNFNGRPRGVSKSKLGFYDSSKPFTCLDGSRTMPNTHVNDDFCDCPDGSDEPGTSACSAVGGRFHCANKGHKPTNIPSSRVNDGICDCCDGSDEYDGRVECDDRCRELGAKAREEAKHQLEVQQRGYQLREDYSQQGTSKQEERRTELTNLEATLKEAQAEADRLKALKEEAESPETEAKEAHKTAWEDQKAEKQREEAEKAFRELDADGDGSLTVVEIQVHIFQFDKDLSGDVSEEEAKEWLGGEVARSLDYFVSDLWSSISPVLSKPVSADEDSTPAPPVEGEDPQQEEPPTDLPPPPVEEEGDSVPAGEMEDIPGDFGVGEEEPVLPDAAPSPDLYDDDDDVDDDEDYADEGFDESSHDHHHHSSSGSPEEEGMPEYDEATQALISTADAARTAFSDADKKREDMQRQIDDLNKNLNVDLGANSEFFPLQGQCYDFTDREYTYSLCPFDRVSQRSKTGGSETSLGTWGKWDGGDGNKYSVMKYENGLNCWNGPNRSGTVKLRCGESNELVSAAEPNRCEYSFEFFTPAACQSPSRPAEPTEHDEL